MMSQRVSLGGNKYGIEPNLTDANKVARDDESWETPNDQRGLGCQLSYRCVDPFERVELRQVDRGVGGNTTYWSAELLDDDQETSFSQSHPINRRWKFEGWHSTYEEE